MSTSPKKPRSRRYLLGALIGVPLALLLGAGYLHAQHLMRHGYTPPDQQVLNLEHVHAMLAKVGASAAQLSRIDGYLDQATKELQAAHNGLGNAHRELAELLLAPTVDQGRIEALRAGEVATLDAASRQLVAAMQGAVQVLTPEQRARLLDLHHPHGG